MLRRTTVVLGVLLGVSLAAAPPSIAGRRPSRMAERREVRRISEIRADVSRALAARPKRAGELPAQLRILQEVVERHGIEVAGRLAPRLGVALSGDRVLVAIRLVPDGESAVTRRLGELGAQAFSGSAGQPMRALVPVTELSVLAASDGVLGVEAPRFFSPTVLSEGVLRTGAESWMTFEPPAGLPLDRPARVAIVDVGFVGYAALLGSELPAAVDIQAFCSFPPASVEHCDSFTVTQPFEHGTAVAEIVHDMAPEAELMLLAIDPDVANIQAALEYARSHGADVISSSIGTQFDDRDGRSELCTTASSLRRSGIVWATSAGNSGDPCEHESYTWRASGVQVGSPYGQFLGFPRKTDPVLNEFVVPAGYYHLLQLIWNAWDGPPPDDFDLFYFCDLGAGYDLIAASIDFQCGEPGSVPLEGLTLLNDTGADLSCAYAIAEYEPGSCARPSNRRFEMLSFLVELETGRFACPLLEDGTSAYSISHPADCADTFAVGAVCSADGSFESYSAEGPTLDGRAKPEICAPDAVSTETYGAALDCPAGTLSPGFSGTSASAPHAAGALALLFQRTGASFTPDQCREILERRAVPLPGSPPSDARCGAGALCLAADGCP